MKYPSKSAAERFWAKVDHRGPDECWNWTGHRAERRYGTFWVDGKTRSPHRWVYETYVDDIAPGMQIDHLCRNTWCVNLRHLELVTPAENTYRSNNPTAINRRKTHCYRGHPLDDANTYVDRLGKRNCRECRKRRKAEFRRRHRVAVAA